MIKKSLLTYFGHHKCGTTWLNGIIVQICRRTALSFVNVHNPKMFNKNLNSFLQSNKIDFLSYTNADFKYVSKIDNFKGFHVIRDPRDIVVSAYFSHRYSHPTDGWPELVGHREKLEKLPKSEGLFLEMEFLEKDVFQNLYNWNYHQSNVIEVKMETLIKNPVKTLVGIFDFMNMTYKEHHHTLSKHFLSDHLKEQQVIVPFCKPRKISEEELASLIHCNRFSMKANGRQPGEEDVRSHYRKGIAGDWINHFTTDHKEYFKKKYNDLLLLLGYENQTDW